MPCDLEVDTDHIRQAARALAELAEVALLPAAHLSTGLATAGSAGASAAVREVTRLASARAEQSLTACAALGGRLAELAQLLGRVSRAFDEVEMLCAGGG